MLIMESAMSLRPDPIGPVPEETAGFARAAFPHGAEQQLLGTLLTICRERGWLHARGRQRTDSTHVLAAIRAHNRVEAVRETVRHTLNVLAEQVPEWLLQHVQPDWAERYRTGWDDTRLPSKQAERDALVAQVGRTVWRCCARWLQAMRHPACGPSRPLNCCARSGSRT